jgi:hypothetical protein
VKAGQTEQHFYQAMLKSAAFSPCRTYRYALWRIWQPQEPQVLFIGLNPSTADEQTDDPTIRRCQEYARAWGYGGLLVANLFAYRATNPASLRSAENPVGPQNDGWLNELTGHAGLVVAAWGNHGLFRRRWKEVASICPELYCLGQTRLNQPRHPLYAKKSLLPKRWQP